MIDEAKLGAYVDGELDAPAREEVEGAANAEPEVAMRLARHQWLRDGAGKAFAVAMNEATPQILIDAVLTQPPRGTSSGVVARGWLTAAGVAVGVFIGSSMHLGQPPLVPSSPGGWRATGPLARALETQPAGSGGAIRIGFSFRAQQGGYCRTFEIARERLAGLACRDGKIWRAPVTATMAPDSVSPYRTATSATPAAILAAVDERMDGDPLSPQAETARRAAHWTAP